LRRTKDKTVQVLDVRPEDEFALGHVPGARNVPLNQLKRYLSKLDRRTEIVAYCRGRYCVMSFEAVAQLRERGFSARRLEDGLPEWKAAGLPVAIKDVNGDGKPDLVAFGNRNIYGGGGLVGVFLGHGDGTFEPAGATSTGGQAGCSTRQTGPW
jgi:rhodanese-related sulfurtransferase